MFLKLSFNLETWGACVDSNMWYIYVQVQGLERLPLDVVHGRSAEKQSEPDTLPFACKERRPGRVRAAVGRGAWPISGEAIGAGHVAVCMQREMARPGTCCMARLSEANQEEAFAASMHKQR